MLLAYYSSATGNTHAFIKRLSLPSLRITKDEPTFVHEPYVLVVPTYADGNGMGAVPKAVVRFLNNEENRHFMRGVIAGGNRNFGAMFALSGTLISAKCKVPCLYRFELRGTDQDADITHTILKNIEK